MTLATSKLLVIFFTFLSLSCAKQDALNGSDVSSSILEEPNLSELPVKVFSVKKTFGHDESETIEIDGSQEIEYIITKLSASPKVPMQKDNPTSFKDAIHVELMGVKEEWKNNNYEETKFQIEKARLVGRSETHQWNSPAGIKTPKLIFRFSQDPRFAADPAVRIANTRAYFLSLFIKYKDPKGMRYRMYRYTTDDNDALNPKSIEVNNASAHTISIDNNQRIKRIDMRVGDMNADGSEGTAKSMILINGEKIAKDERNVEKLGTQYWLVGNYKPGDNLSNEITVRFVEGNARIHWIKIYAVPVD